VLAQIFSVNLGILPSLGYKGFEYTILPAFVLAVGISPFIIRTLSVSIAQVMQLGALLGVLLVVELIFDYPGLGRLTINAVLQRDFPIIQGVAIFISAIFVFINIIVDLAASYIDPRLEY